MAKQLPFVFDLPLMQEVNGRRLAEHIGDLRISGIGYQEEIPGLPKRYSHRIEQVKWNGVDVFPLLNHLSHTTGYNLLHISEAAADHIMKAFEDDEPEYVAPFEEPGSYLSRDHHHHTIGTL